MKKFIILFFVILLFVSCKNNFKEIDKMKQTESMIMDSYLDNLDQYLKDERELENFLKENKFKK